MVEPSTPRRLQQVVIPPSPFLKKLGYGAGVSVFEMVRSPKVGKIQSPWAIKSVIKKHEKMTVYGKRLLAEADLLKKMNHPNVVGFRTMAKMSDGRSCLAMEKCETSLGTMIEERREAKGDPYIPRQILKMTLDVAKGLDYIHTKALLLHGDIKSYNILINGDFEICKLCDFGVSLPLDAHGQLNSCRSKNDYIGTESWAAPEVFNENGLITSKTDIFSFGLTIWEMMALDIPHSFDPFEASDIMSDEDSMIVNDSLNDTENNCEDYFGTRPTVPDIDASEYKDVLGLFYCTTEQDPRKRPSADHIILFATSTYEKCTL